MTWLQVLVASAVVGFVYGFAKAAWDDWFKWRRTHQEAGRK